jgi:hypothetical protein
MGRRTNLLFQAILLVPLSTAMASQTTQQETAPAVDHIVDRMREHDATQSKELKQYQAVRHYQVQYKGFKTTLGAKMDVEVDYDQASGKSFRILSQSGSKLLCDKVLKRAVESETEASQDKQSTALTPSNYRFQLAGTEMLDGRQTYVLHVDPLRDGKFLYRGSIWVDAADYAVQKIEVEPAKNPSFWISSTKIDSVNSQTQGIWLPHSNRSESKIRIGGTAVLTIDYGAYHVVLSSQAQPAAPSEHSPHPGATEAASSR